MKETSKNQASPQSIRIDDYAYELPEERIARYPLAQRDASKLLVYQGGQIRHQQFRDLPSLLPAGAVLLFNDTKVIHARLRFELDQGRAFRNTMPGAPVARRVPAEPEPQRCRALEMPGGRQPEVEKRRD
jgi:hypothetical protein